MSLLRFPEKRYLKNAIYGTVTLLPIAVVGPKPCVVSARLYPHRYDGAALFRYIVVDAENIGIIYDDAQGYGYKSAEAAKRAFSHKYVSYHAGCGDGFRWNCGCYAEFDCRSVLQIHERTQSYAEEMCASLTERRHGVHPHLKTKFCGKTHQI